MHRDSSVIREKILLLSIAGRPDELRENATRGVVRPVEIATKIREAEADGSEDYSRAENSRYPICFPVYFRVFALV